MDYRNRDYFLVRFDSYDYDFIVKTCKKNIKSLKIHPPYNHFKEWKGNNNHDSYHKECGYFQMMMSCRKNETEVLLYELNKSVRKSSFIKFNKYLRVNKDILGQ